MGKVGLLIDSTTLTRDDLNHNFIKTAYLGVTIDEQNFIESDLSTKDMYEHLETAKKMTTSQPAPGEFLRLYQEFFDQGYKSVLVVVLSEKLSGTYQSATIAKSMIDFDLEVEVFSPKVASYGVALGMPSIIANIKRKIPFTKIVEKCKLFYANAGVFFTLDNLMHLYRGGRLSKVSAFLGTMLRIKPIIEMVDGKLVLVKKERTNIACYNFFMKVIDEYHQRYKTVHLDIITLQREQWAEKLKEEVSKKYPSTNIHITDYVSPVFFVHLGNNGFGISLSGQ